MNEGPSNPGDGAAADDSPSNTAPHIPATPVHDAPVLSYADPLQAAIHGNRVLMEQHADGGVSFLLRPPGLLREIISLLVLGTFAGLPGIGAMVATISAINYRESFLLVLAAVALLIAAFPAVLLVSIYRAATRAGTIVLRDGWLHQYSPASLLQSERKWAASTIMDFRVSWRGVSVAGRAVADLELVLVGRGRVILYAGRDKRELEWIARGLRAALGLQQ